MYQDRIAKILQAEMPLAGNGYVQDVAKRIADEVYGYITITGVRLNGKKVKIRTVDKGTVLPGYRNADSDTSWRKGSIRFEAYTRWWAVLPLKNKTHRTLEEDYIQVDFYTAENSGNPRTYREAVEIEAFTKAGFDPYSFKLPDGSPMYVRER